MGVDLTLLPFDCDYDDLSYSHVVLNLERRGDLWTPIQRLEDANQRRVPERFMSYLSRDEEYEEPHYGRTTETPYGDPLLYVTSAELLTLSEHEGVTDNAKNRATWAYLRELPKETKVALYWY